MSGKVKRDKLPFEGWKGEVFKSEIEEGTLDRVQTLTNNKTGIVYKRYERKVFKGEVWYSPWVNQEVRLDKQSS